MDVRSLLEVFASEIKPLAETVKEMVKHDKYVKQDPPVEDKGLPVKGTCVVPSYPIYITPVESRGSEGFLINPIDKVLGMLPGEAARVSSGKFFTPAPDFSGWMLIDKEKVSSTAHREQVLGNFEIWLDWRAPNKEQVLQKLPTRLMMDFVLRADIKGVTDTKGFDYYDVGQTGDEAVEEESIMVLTRVDCAITFNTKTCEWRMYEGVKEPSPINNVTQHKSIVATVKEGRATYTGEQIAKMVMSVESGLKIMADWYETNLDMILTPTKYKVLHPLDTRGYFLRKSATAATVLDIGCHRPTHDSFPVYIYDTTLKRWFGISNGFFGISESSVPASREKAGVLMGAFEVWYDTNASDTYTNSQLGWLLRTVMCSRFMPTSEGHIAMYGCMSYLNNFISRIMSGGVIKSLEAAAGTRIADLTRQSAELNKFEVAFDVGGTICRAHTYDSNTGVLRMVPGHVSNAQQSIVAECDEFDATPTVLANLLSAISSSGMFSNWEANLQSEEELELIKPGPAIVAFYSKSPHAGMVPNSLAEQSPVYVQTGDGMFGIRNDGRWGICPDSAEDLIKHLKLCPAGTMFGHQLYCNPESHEGVHFDNERMSALIYSTAEYFVPFEQYPTLFAYIYNLDKDTDTWKNTGIASSNNRVTFGNNHVLSYDIETHLWECVPDAGFERDTKLENLISYDTPPGEVTFTPEDIKVALESLQQLLPTIHHTESADVPVSLEYPRYIADRAEEVQWTIDFGGLHYTIRQGDWALSELEVHGDATVSMTDFIGLVVGWLISFASYRDAGCGLKVVQEILGMDEFLSDKCSVNINQFIVYTDQQHVYVMGEGLDDGVGLEAYTNGRFVPSGGVHPVHLAVRGDAFGIPLKLAAQVLCNIPAVDELVTMYRTKLSKLPKEELEKGYKGYRDKTEGYMLSASKLSMSEIKTKRPAILAFDNEGDMFGWTGREFYKLDTVDGFVKVGAPYDCGVYYREGMEDSPMPIGDLKYVFYRLLTVAWPVYKSLHASYIMYEYILGRYREW